MRGKVTVGIYVLVLLEYVSHVLVTDLCSTFITFIPENIPENDSGYSFTATITFRYLPTFGNDSNETTLYMGTENDTNSNPDSRQGSIEQCLIFHSLRSCDTMALG
jgi:hypothetical protein